MAVIQFLATPLWRKVLLMEGAVTLLFARVLTLFPMRVYTRFCGRADRETMPTLSLEKLETVSRIGSAVRRAATVVPFKAMCIEQALAASVMLRIRGIQTTTCLGVHRNAAKREANHLGYNSHAWLKAGEEIVIGGPDVSEYVVLAKFA